MKSKALFLSSMVIMFISVVSLVGFVYPKHQDEAIKTAITASKDNSDYMLLARIISAEARGEPYEGQVAVGAVILNRIEHPSFPDTLSGVIFQPLAFSCVDDGQIYEEVAESAYRAATDALNGWDPSGGAIYYYNPVTATSKWIRSREIVKQIGKHVFCF